MEDHMVTNRIFWVIGVGLLVASCASGPPRKPVESPPAAVTDGGPRKLPGPARIKDSAPEKAAALRAADPNNLQLESEDERWGIEAARERRRTTDEEREAEERRQKDKRSKTIAPFGPGFRGDAPPAPSAPSSPSPSP
jgi:hypothetical protein